MYRRTFRLASLLDGLAWAAPAWLYLLAAAALAAKIIGQWSALADDLVPVALAATVVVLAGAAWLRSRRNLPDNDFVRAWLDWRNHAGGRVLANAPDAWPALGVRPGLSPLPLLKALALPLLFLCLVAVVPERTARANGSGAGVGRKIAQVELAIQAAESGGALPPDAARELRERLRSVEEGADRNPETAAEAADAVRRQLEDAVLARVEAGLQSLEKAARARDALAQQKSDPSQIRDALGQLAAALAALSRAEGGGLSENIADVLKKIAPQAKLGDLADLADLASRLSAGDLSGIDADKLRKLVESLCQATRRYGECAGSCPLGPDARRALAALMDGIPALSGRSMDLDGEMFTLSGGGIGRGRQDARLAFGRESDAAGARFTPRALPAGIAFVPGMRLGVDRVPLPDEAMPPEEFRPVRRSGVGVDGPVRAGDAGGGLGPVRAEAAAEYFSRLSKKSSD